MGNSNSDHQENLQQSQTQPPQKPPNQEQIAFQQKTKALIADVYSNLKIGISENDPIMVQYFLNERANTVYFEQQQKFLDKLTNTLDQKTFKPQVNLDNELEDFKKLITDFAKNLQENKKQNNTQILISEIEKCFSTMDQLLNKYSLVTIENRNSLADIKQSLIKINNLNDINESQNISKLQFLTNLLQKTSWIIIGGASVNFCAMGYFWFKFF